MTWNLADIFGVIFLALGIWDGYKKGLVKKGMSLAITLAAFLVVYMAAPSVEAFFRSVLPEALSFENLVGDGGDIYETLFLSGLKEQAAEYVTMFAARILSLVVTYIVARLLLRLLFVPLEALVKVPGLSLLNRLTGACFGLFQQVVTLWVFFLLLMVFSGTSWGGFLSSLVRGSAWMSSLYENNLLLLFGILFLIKV